MYEPGGQYAVSLQSLQTSGRVALTSDPSGGHDP